MPGGQVWTEAEEQRLREAWSAWQGRATEFDRAQAVEFGRSPKAIHQHRNHIGLKCPHPGTQPGSDALPADPSIDEHLLDYTVAGGSYVFVVAGKIFKVPVETWESICADYSDLGGGLTQAEIARQYGIPKPVLAIILRLARQYKASLPASRETIAAEPESALVERSIEAKEHRVMRRLDAERVVRMEREYERLRRMYEREERFLDVARRVVADLPPPKVTVPKPKRQGEPWAAHAPTTDEHVGLLVWGDESFGENYDTDIACHRVRRHADVTAEWIVSQPGRCRVARRTLIGDLTHSLLGETEHGTRLDQDTRSAKVWGQLLHALRYSIEAHRRAADVVEVYGVPGNHDGRFEFYAAMYSLRLMYEGIDDVRVLVEPGKFSAFREADTLHVLDHGYGTGAVGAWKAKAQAGLVAREMGSLYKGADYIYTYLGHKHEHEVGAHGDHELVRLPALCENDDYSTSLRFSGSLAALAFRLDARGRIEETRRFYGDALA